MTGFSAPPELATRNFVIKRASALREGATPALFFGAALLITLLRLLIYRALAPQGLAAGLCQWDCGWYMSIVEDGYDLSARLVAGHLQLNWAFFPLYPLLTWGVTRLTGLDPRLAAIGMSSACFVGFAVLARSYRAATRDTSRAASSGWTWLWFLMAWPFGFYFQAPYTESLYAMLATAGLLALTRNRPFAAGGAIGLLTATRPTGMLLAAALGVRQLCQLRAGQSRREIELILLPAVIGGLGLLGFMIFLALHVGDPLAFLWAQTAWDHHAGNPLAVLLSGFQDFSLANHHVGRSYESAWGVAALGAAIWLAARRHWMEAWVCGASVLMALGAGTTTSVPRYVAANPAFLFAAADLFEALPSWRWRAAGLSGMATVQIVLVLAWYKAAHFLL